MFRPLTFTYKTRIRKKKYQKRGRTSPFLSIQSFILIQFQILSSKTLRCFGDFLCLYRNNFETILLKHFWWLIQPIPHFCVINHTTTLFGKVSMLNRIWAGRPEFDSRKADNDNVQTGSVIHPASCPMSIRICPGDKATGAQS